MIKNFVLDTNVLLHDPAAIFKFHDNRIIVPITVIEELDHFKKELTVLGRNARTVSKYLDQLRGKGRIAEGVPIDNGGILRVAFDGEGAALLPVELRGTKEDNQILAVALGARAKDQETPVVLVTKDTNLRIKADALGLRAEDYESDRVKIEELYEGFREATVEKEWLDAFYAAGESPPPDGEDDLYPNEYLVMRASGSQASALGKFDAAKKRVKVLPPFKDDVWGIRPRSKE
jgi:PhoH-like ATPase